MLGMLGLALFVPFLAYVCNLLRKAQGQGDGDWLASAAFGAGLMGMTLKLVSGVPEIAYSDLPSGSQTHHTLESLGSAATIVSLYPFAIFMTIVALQSLRLRALPYWLGALAALTALALIVNGSFEHAASVPAFLLFIVWTLVAGAALFIHELRLHPRRSHEPLTPS